ncbi:MAG TPA: nucleotidyltransferase domain-containing protein [Thermoprotei archaeon]|nr:nucleotidyltransferase domain-containing protein [Thermoprotei archaeon]
MKFSYVKVYSALLLRFGLEVFDLDKVYSELGWLGVKTPLNIIMQRLCRKGYIERVGRGKYRVVHPTILLLESLGYRWRDRVASEYRPILEYVVSRLIEYFRERLVSIVLYGSLARGEARDTSDIDLLIIAVDIPGNYSERVEQISRILDDVSRFRYRLWMEKRIYPLIDIIILDREEAMVNHPLYLDMVYDAIIIYDRDSFMEKRIEAIRRKLDELGSRRIQLPDGRYYWVLKPDLKWGEVIEL